jgi:hypothetical protein
MNDGAGLATPVINVVLEGGPRHLPSELRSLRLPATDRKVKIRYGDGYEHFERDVESGPVDDTVVFRWTCRTRVAE